MKQVNVGIIGCGIISERHLQAYRRNAELGRIVACCDADPQRARARAEQAQGAKVYTQWEDLLADPEVEAVDLCLPHYLHHPAVLQSLKAGKHVLCEKPIATTLEQADEMIQWARQSGKVFAVAENYRYAPVVRKAQEMIQQGEIGELIVLTACFDAYLAGDYMKTQWRFTRDQSGGGQLLDSGIHFIEVMRALGGAVQSVFSATRRVRPELGEEDLALVILRYRGGALGQLLSSHSCPAPAPKCFFTVYGTRGTLGLIGPDGGLTLYKPDGGKEVLIPQFSYQETFDLEIQNFLQAIRGEAPLLFDPVESRESLRVVLAAYEAEEKHQEIFL